MSSNLQRVSCLLALSLILATHVAASEQPELLARAGRQTDRSALWEHRPVLLQGFKNMYNFDILHVTSTTAPGLADVDTYPWRAWFFGWVVEDCNPLEPGCDAIYTARSRNLESGWEVWSGDDGWTTTPTKWRAVVAAQDKPYDAWHNGDPSVVREGDYFYMAYSATGPNLDGILYGEKGDRDGTILCVNGARSRDGVHWEKTSAPIALNPHDLGAPPTPEGESHLHGSYQRPSLLRENNRWRLWFDTWANAKDGVSLGYAENTGDFMDPAQWHVLASGREPLSPQWVNPNVIRIGAIYFSYADPPVHDSPEPWTNRKLSEAISLDGRHWRMLGYVNPPAGIPAAHVPQALAVEADGKQWIDVTYGRQNGGTPYDYRYSSIGMMRREITPADLAAYEKLLRTPQK